MLVASWHLPFTNNSTTLHADFIAYMVAHSEQRTKFEMLTQTHIRLINIAYISPVDTVIISITV